jgi:hypothetical protein
LRTWARHEKSGKRRKKKKKRSAHTDRAQLYPLGDFSNMHFEKYKFGHFFWTMGLASTVD